MTNKKMLEDLANLLKEEKNWEKTEAPLTKGRYIADKEGLRFSVYMLDLSRPSYRLSISGNGQFEYFEGQPVQELYESLVKRYGPIDTETLKRKREEAALELALAKLRGE